MASSVFTILGGTLTERPTTAEEGRCYLDYESRIIYRFASGSWQAQPSMPIAHSEVTSVTPDQHHVRLHSIIGLSDHNSFPGGTTNFLRADGIFATPPGGSQAFAVGGVYINLTGVNPNTELGYGTWVAFAVGRTLVGLDAADPDFDTVREMQGAKTATPSAHAGSAVANHVFTQPSAHAAHSSDGGHTHNAHTQGRKGGTTNPQDIFNAPVTHASGGAHAHDAHSAHAGGAVDAHGVTQPSAHAALSVVQPSVVVYFWERTA